MKSYNKSDFKARDSRKTAVYFSVNEDFEAECNAESTLLDGFNLFLFIKYSPFRKKIDTFGTK